MPDFSFRSLFRTPQILLSNSQQVSCGFGAFLFPGYNVSAKPEGLALFYTASKLKLTGALERTTKCDRFCFLLRQL